METAFKIAAMAVVAVVFCVLLRENARVQAVLLSVAVCAVILVLSIQVLTPIWTVLQRLQRLSGLEDGVTAPLLKVAGIGLVTHGAAGVCTDAGESALAKTVEAAGSLLAFYAAIPLLTAVINLLEQLLGGTP